MALSHIGTTATIEDFDEASIEAKQIKLWYDFSRLQVLEALDWNFARKRLVLAEHSDAAPIPEWQYRYQYPADCVVLRKLVSPYGKTANVVPFKVENSLDGTVKTIVTDLETASADYTFDLSATSLFSPMFIEALSYLLASHIAYPIRGDLKIAQNCFSTFLMTLRLAEASNANEQGQEEPRDAEWIRAR